MANFIKHEPCPKCGSKDNLAIYDDGSYHCFSNCGYKKPSVEYLELQDNTPSKQSKDKMKEDMQIKPSSKPAITEEGNAEIKSETTIKAGGFRGIRDDIYAMFGVRHSLDETDGSVMEQYYPVTQEGQLSGYKIRTVPKNFRSKGRTGADCDLFMQFKFNRGGKYVTVCEGELCALSSYQMLSDYNKSKGSPFEIACVSPTTGAQSKKQIAAQYKFLDSFDHIILAMDNDKAGKEAAEEILKYLPKGKVKIMQMRYKDHNEYLEKGKEKEYIADFYNAKAYVPAGVMASTELYGIMLEQVAQDKIPLPPVFSKLSEMLGGGLTLGHAYTCSGVTGGGKTSLTNEMIYHWIFNSPHLVGVVSLELSASQYGEALLSRHLHNKISKMSASDKMDYLRSDKVKEAAKELFEHPDGRPRFYLLDNRDSSLDQLQETIEEMVICSGVRLVVCDPWTDMAVDGLSIDEQAVAMKWIKSMIKSHNCSFFLINHVRKSQSGQKDQSSGAMISEADIIGSSTIAKSSSANILLVRNKMATEELERNTTQIFLSKNRLLSDTGPAGEVYYDSATSSLHNLEDWIQENGVTSF